jgi:hypothetical protein
VKAVLHAALAILVYLFTNSVLILIHALPYLASIATVILILRACT